MNATGGPPGKAGKLSTALTILFSVFPMAVFRFIHSPAIGAVPGAVATGSVAPGRYRSRYRTGGHFHVPAIASWRAEAGEGQAFVEARRWPLAPDASMEVPPAERS